jgi:hypothetical protein
VPKITAADVAIDQAHCRAIRDEIGERLRYLLKREVTDIPPNLLRLIKKLDELDCIPVVVAPSIVPPIDQVSPAEALSDESFGLSRMALA